MNPKSVNDLDPKLKEAYERIMGTNLASPPQAPPAESKPEQSNTPLMQTTPVVMQNPVQPPPVQNVPPSPIPSKNPFAPVPQPPLSVFNQSGSVSATPKKKLSFLPILLIIGGLIFFAVYIFIWLRVFSLI